QTILRPSIETQWRGIILRGQWLDRTIGYPGDSPAKHLADLEGVVGLLAVAQQGLEDTALAVAIGPGQRFELVGDLRLGTNERIVRLISILVEIQLIDDLEPRQSRGDGMSLRRRHYQEPPEGIVTAGRLAPWRRVIPDTADDLAVFRPVRLACLG